MIIQKLQKFLKIAWNSEPAENTKSVERHKQRNKWTSFPKECIEKRDLYKPVLNEIMTAQEILFYFS